MKGNPIINEDEISGQDISASYSELAHKHFELQMNAWELARRNYELLSRAKVRTIALSPYTFQLRHINYRISSTTAVHHHTIAETNCLICPPNLPNHQKALIFKNKYLFLVNPYPILREHFTITHEEHIAQRLPGHFDDLLSIAQGLEHYTIFYNGAHCGASVPDHLHFQAVSKDKLPLDNDYNKLKRYFEFIAAGNQVMVYGMPHYPAKFFAIEGENPRALRYAFQQLLAIMPRNEQDDEPMLNIIAAFRKQKWRIILFPRRQHRPWQYFAEGDKNILISPGCADLAGALTLPALKDFNKLEAESLKDIMQQVSINQKIYDNLKFEARQRFARFHGDRFYS